MRRDDLAANLASVEQRIAAACHDAGRPRSEVTLVAVTKFFPQSDVELLRDLGVGHVGENRHPEAESKVTPGVVLHFIGGVQTNKAGAVARYADVVESVDRIRLAEALSRGAVAADRSLDVLLQVDFESGASAGRSGVAPAALAALADVVADLPNLRLKGVMTVAPLGVDPAPVFDELVELSRRLRDQHPDADVISAGMSGDLEQAVAAGATHLRVGRSILGERALSG